MNLIKFLIVILFCTRSIQGMIPSLKELALVEVAKNYEKTFAKICEINNKLNADIKNHLKNKLLEENWFLFFEIFKTRSCRVLSRKTKPITALACNQDGSLALAGTTNGQVSLWSIGKTSTSIVLRGCKASITTILFSPDGQWAVAGASDNTVCLWKINVLDKNALPHTIIRDAIGPITSIAFNNQSTHLIIGSSDTIARVYDITTNPVSCSNILAGHTAPITSVKLSSHEKFALTGSSDNTTRIWDLIDNSFRVLQHTLPVSVVAFSHAGDAVFTACDDSKSYVWDITGASPVRLAALAKHEKPVSALAVCSDDIHVLTGSNDCCLYLWDLSISPPSWRTLYHGHSEPVKSAYIADDAQYVLTHSSFTARLWNLKSSSLSYSLLKNSATVVKAIASSPNFRYVLIGSEDSLELWNLKGLADDLSLLEVLLIVKSHNGDSPLKSSYGRAILNNMTAATKKLVCAYFDKKRPKKKEKKG